MKFTAASGMALISLLASLLSAVALAEGKGTIGIICMSNQEASEAEQAGSTAARNSIFGLRAEEKVDFSFQQVYFGPNPEAAVKTCNQQGKVAVHVKRTNPFSTGY